ncbi:MAG TPA: hypothetical protein VN969_25230 [Streptosporangiaceae bacterium]|nr:hypothetical protein [Streptosporangiaceae bacterium]
MRLLILGGTWFLGRTLAEVALGCGWEVTTFSRGLHGRDVLGAVPVRGRREDPGDLARLAAAGPWDAVVDTSGYDAEAVAAAAQVLRGQAGRYVLISTVNAYRGWPAARRGPRWMISPSRPPRRAAASHSHAPVMCAQMTMTGLTLDALAPRLRMFGRPMHTLASRPVAA